MPCGISKGALSAFALAVSLFASSLKWATGSLYFSLSSESFPIRLMFLQVVFFPMRMLLA